MRHAGIASRPRRDRRSRARRRRSSARRPAASGSPGRATLRTAARAGRATRRWARGAGRCAAARPPAAGWPRTSRRVRCSCSCSPRSPRSSSPSRSSTSTASSGSGLPAQRHSRVRSFGSTEKQMPWSTPYTWPSGIGMMCPPLRSALFTTASKTAIRRSAGSSRRTNAGEVDVVVAVHPELHHAGPERPVAQHGGRHDPPAGRLGDEEGRDLPAGEGAVGEVPERPLPRDRLVDALGGERAGADRADQGHVRGVEQPALEVDLAVAQQAQRLGVVRGGAQVGRGRLLAHRQPPLSGGSRSAAGRRARPGPAAASTAGTAGGRRPRRGGRGRRRPGRPSA